MIRTTCSVSTHKRHKKILSKAKGYYGCRSRTYRSAYQSVIKSYQYSYIDRKRKKREFRKLWIIKINAAVRKNNLTYSKFIYNLKKNNISINRKILSNLILNKPNDFNLIIKKIINI